MSLAGAFLPPLDVFIVNAALPSVRADLHAPATTMQMTVSACATAYAVMLTGHRGRADEQLAEALPPPETKMRTARSTP